MRDSFMPLLLWVLFPLGLAGLAGHFLSTRESGTIARASTARLGRLGASLLRGEMGHRSISLAREAGPVTDPDLRSPLIRAVLEGDTVAALGTSSGELTLSLALGQQSGDSLELRAITVPFPAESLDLLRTRAGIGAALYLRGRKARGSPGDFGPPSLPGETGDPEAGSLPSGSVILPLTPLTESTPGPSPARILVAPLAPPDAAPPLRETLFLILVAWISATLIWLIPPRRKYPVPHPLRRFLLAGIPLLLLWTLLGAQERAVAEKADTLLRQDLIRVLASIQDAGRFLSPEEIPAATGFHLLKREGREVMNTDLPPGLDATTLGDIPVPASPSPTLGRTGDGRSAVFHAGLAESTGSELLLVAPQPDGGLVTLRLLLAGLGGIVSLLALGFLARGPGNSLESTSG